MFQIISIKLAENESSADDEARYEICVLVDNDSLVFPAEVRPGPNGLQLDWSDEFQGLMMSHDADFAAVNLLLYRVHCREAVTFPVAAGNAA